MATGMFENGVNQIMNGNIDLVNATISCVLIDSDFYTPNLNTDAVQSSVPVAAQIAEVNLTGNELDGSTFRADDTVFTSVTGAKVDALLIVENTGDYNTSRLLHWIDDAAEFPITPDGTDITIEWSSGSNGIFRL